MGFLLPVQALALFVPDENEEAETTDAKAWLTDPEKRLWNVRRDPGLCVRFPTTGEPRNKYREENRQDRIRVGNLNRKDGWLPCDPPGWWDFYSKGSDELVPQMFNEVYVIVQGSKRKLVWE